MLADGQEREIVFTLGVAGSRPASSPRLAAREALERVERYWARTLGAVQVETPERSFDLLANGWLLYQTLACRLWARRSEWPD